MNNNDPSTTGTAAGLVIAAGAAYGAYKLFQSMFGSSEPEVNHQMQFNSGIRYESIRFGASEPQVNHQVRSSSARRNDNIYIVDTTEKLNDALKRLKSYVKFSMKNFRTNSISLILFNSLVF